MIGITGGNGFLAKVFIQKLIEVNEDFILIKRDKSKVGFDLSGIHTCSYVLHFAWDTRNRKTRNQLESAQKSVKLQSICKEKGIKFIFISTYDMDTEGKTKSNYTKYKVIAENEIISNGGFAVKVPFVIDTLGFSDYDAKKSVVVPVTSKADFQNELFDYLIKSYTGISKDRYTLKCEHISLASVLGKDNKIVLSCIKLINSIPKLKTVYRILGFFAIFPTVNLIRDRLMTLIGANEEYRKKTLKLGET